MQYCRHMTFMQHCKHMRFTQYSLNFTIYLTIICIKDVLHIFSSLSSFLHSNYECGENLLRWIQFTAIIYQIHQRIWNCLFCNVAIHYCKKIILFNAIMQKKIIGDLNLIEIMKIIENYFTKTSTINERYVVVYLSKQHN